MDEIQTVIPQIQMLFCIAAVGWILRRIHVFTNEVIKGVNSITLKAAWPAMILMTTQKDCTEESLQGFLIVFAFTLVLLLVLMVILGWGCAGLFKDRNNQVYTLLAVMPNAGFVGLPIIEALYGSVGVLYLAAFLAAFNFVLWTVGVLLFSDFSLKNLKCMLNPGLIASVIGTLLFLLKICCSFIFPCHLFCIFLSGLFSAPAMQTSLYFLCLGHITQKLERDDPFQSSSLMISYADLFQQGSYI